jgi:syntaxin 5
MYSDSLPLSELLLLLLLLLLKDVLQVRSSKLKEQAERKDMFFNKQSAVSLGKPIVYKPMSTTSALTLPPPPKGGPWGADPAEGDGEWANGRQRLLNGNSANSSDGSSSVSSRQHSALPRPGVVTSMPHSEQDADDSSMSSAMIPLIPEGSQRRHQQQQQQQMQLIPDQSYLESRTSAMQDVESHIVELGTIFNRLATMLQDQRELVENVHDNVEDAEQNVHRGQLALMATLRSLQSNRMLAAKVSGVLVLFMLFFVIFMA